jgi:hypothetical protein
MDKSRRVSISNTKTNIQHKMKAIRAVGQSNGVAKMTFSKEADIQIISVVKF